MDRFKNKFRVQSARLKDFDYSLNGVYFVTICTKDKIRYFGEIRKPVETDYYLAQVGRAKPKDFFNAETDNNLSLGYSAIGKIAHEFWQQIPEHYSWVELDEFVIMPNHIHGILVFKKENPNANKPNSFGKQSGNLAAIIRGYKASVKPYANQNNIDF